MALRAVKSDEDASRRPAYSPTAAPFQDTLDTEPPCLSKRVFRTPCNRLSPALNRDFQGTGVFNGVPLWPLGPPKVMKISGAMLGTSARLGNGESLATEWRTLSSLPPPDSSGGLAHGSNGQFFKGTAQARPKIGLAALLRVSGRGKRKWACSILAAAMFGVFLPRDAQAQYGPGAPFPGIHRRPADESQSSSRTSSKDNASPNDNFEAEGRVQSIDAKALVVATSDGRLLRFKLTDSTAFVENGKTVTASTIRPRTMVHVEAKEDGESYLTARRVELLKGPAAKPTPVAPQTAAAEDTHPEALSTPLDAPGRPVLRRGGPSEEHKGSAPGSANGRSSSKERDVTDDDLGIIIEAPAKEDGAPGGATATSSSQELIRKAKDWVGSFSSELPNYVCQQITTRYQEESKSTGWQPVDVVTAQVIYENGKEQYRNITVGGKKTNKSMLELGGDTSTGEFGSTLRSLFSDRSQAAFNYFRSSNWSRGDAVIYDFKVALHNSDWQIQVGGQTLIPAYSGSVWIDKKTAQVRRIEMQADSIPADFPLDTVQWAIDYDMVPLGTASFLLPVRAENLGCQRGTSTCMKNTIEFRNYHKFAGQSTITYDK